MRGPVTELRAFVNAALIEKVDRDHRDPDDVFRRRQVVVALTFVVGTAVLAWALRITPGDPLFYVATLALAAVWLVGAQHFLDHLLDGDIASNNHGWQWVAGTGTDASPYFRVFNPVTQGKKFDPDGDYVRRWVPELAHLPRAAAHEPWKHDNGYDQDYPRPVVDHDDERRETLARYERARR